MIEDKNNKDIVEESTNKKTLSNGRSIEKQIGIIFLKTFSILIGLIVLTIIIVSLSAPRAMSNFTSWIGMDSVSLYFAKVQYNRDDDINSLYTVINKSIALNSYEDIEKYTKTLFDEPNYYDFIVFIEAENMNSVAQSGDTQNAISLMISFANEDMYLKNKYILSLIMNDKIDESISYAQFDFNMNEDDITLQSRIHWAYTHIFAETENYEFLDAELRNSIVAFANQTYELYTTSDANYEQLSTADKFNFFVLENTLKRVYNDLLSLKDSSIVFEGLSYDEIETRIKNLNGDNV